MDTEQVKRENEDLFDYQTAIPKFQKAIAEWDTRVTNHARIRRNMRAIEVDIRALQMEGKLKVDETIIPIRVIDTNIKAEQPNYLRYVKQSARLAIFKCLDDPRVDDSKVQLIEKDFTAALTYNGWERWVFKMLDGAQLHGWSCVEIEFDESKPGNVNLHAYQHEQVIFPCKARELEFQPWILVRIPLTVHKLKEIAAKYGFDQKQVDLISENFRDKTEVDQEVTIYKVLMKSDGIVHVGWMDLDDGSDNWLKPFSPLYLGRGKLQKQLVMEPDPMTGLVVPREESSWQPIYEEMFPIKIFRYQETEEEVIVETKGRAFLDEPVQEAETALYSAFVNSAVRASNVYGSPAQPSSSGGKLNKLDLTLEHGCFYSDPINFWHTDFPTFDLIKAAQALDVKKQEESGKIAAATMSRPDSRKLAKELELAEQTDQSLGSVQVTFLAITLTEIFTHCWAIIQSRALQEKINFVQIEVPDPLTGQVAWKNDLELIAHDYQVRPAGDKDVVKRDDLIRRRTQLIPVIQGILQMISAAPLTATFFVEYAIDILREVLPEEADKYEMILRQLLQQQQMMLQQQMMQAQQQPQTQEAQNG